VNVGDGSGYLRYDDAQAAFKLQPGDTLYINPGVYRGLSLGNLSGTAANPVTVICDAWAKRSGPKQVSPVIYDGVRYAAPNANGRQGMVEALDQKTGAKLWDKVIYTVKIDPNLEEDVQWVFISALSIRDGKLLVINEKGDQYALDLKTKKIDKIKNDGPAQGTPSPTVSSASKPVAGGRTYDLAFSTFFGKKMDCRGMTVDAQGNVYLAGSTWDSECPTTPGAFDCTFHGEADMAISKWSP